MGGRYIFSAVPIENAVKTIYPRENIYIKRHPLGKFIYIKQYR